MLQALIRVKATGYGGLVMCLLVVYCFVVSFTLRLLMCLLVQHANRWRYVSFWWDVHGLHVGDTSFRMLGTHLFFSVLP